VARLSSAKAATAVQIRSGPQRERELKETLVLFFIELTIDDGQLTMETFKINFRSPCIPTLSMVHFQLSTFNYPPMSRLTNLMFLTVFVFSTNLFSQKCSCEIRYYFNVVDYTADSESKASFIPYVTTNIFLNDSIYISRLELCKYKPSKRRVKFDYMITKLIWEDTFLVRNSNVWLLKNNTRFIIYSLDSFYKKRTTYKSENLYDVKTNKQIGTITDYYIPLKDSVMDKKKVFLYKSGYVKSYFNDSDLYKNTDDTGFVELNSFYYLPGYGAVYQFNEDNYYKYQLLSKDKKCEKLFEMIFKGN